MLKNAAHSGPGGLVESSRRADQMSPGRAQLELAAHGLVGLDRRSVKLDRSGSEDAVSLTDSPALAAKPLVLMVGEMGFMSLLKYVIESNGFDCILTEDCAKAVALAEIERPDLIVLDDFQSPGSAWVTRQKMFEKVSTRQIPVLILASESIDPGDVRIQSAGKADHLLKPFSPDTFIGRLHDQLRQSRSVVSSSVLRFADIIMDLDAHRVYRNRRCVRLGPVEYGVLQELLSHPRKVLSRNKILATVRQHTDQVAERSVDVHISRIRKELCAQGEPNYIRTVRGVGYSLDAAPDGPATYTIRPKSVRAVV